jgi:catechol 2,3-dioxygenase-like lactoylglutathione lyase family enzyme
MQYSAPIGRCHAFNCYTRRLERLLMLNSITPFFIVDDLAKTIEFYQSRLAFQVLYKGGDENGDFWAMLGRDQIMLMFKAITPEVHPQPNHSRHEWAAWDAYIFTTDPDAVYAEFRAKDVPMHKELANTNDGLRAFEIIDNSGYVLCFARPIEK